MALIDYLLGSEDFLAAPAVEEALFDIEFDAGDRTLHVGRGAQLGQQVALYVNPPVELNVHDDEKSGLVLSSVTNWRYYLGQRFFGLPIVREGEWKKDAPTYRNLVAYFLRREPGGFKYPDLNTEKQQEASKQLAISFFLDFDWRIAKKFESVRDRETIVKQLKLEYKDTNTAEIRTDLAVLERKLQDQRKLMADFRVVPQFRDLELESARIARKIRDLSDENTTDRELVEELNRALTTEAPPSTDRVEELYAEASVILGEQVRRHLSEVREFHTSVIRNRINYLRREMGAAEFRIAGREEKKRSYEQRRAEIMRVLRSGGALEQHTKLQEELSRVEQEVARLRSIAGKASDYAKREAGLKIEREKLRLDLRAELDERAPKIDEAIVAYESVSSSLYGQAGKLTVDDTINGPRLAFPIQGEKSKGINSMRIFCFDMMLVRLLASRGLGPGFLIHDSHLFDGVDERQRATALAVGAGIAEDVGWQYIVTLNSDEMPAKHLFPEDFDLEEYINPVRLTDEQGGGLFGVEF